MLLKGEHITEVRSRRLLHPVILWAQVECLSDTRDEGFTDPNDLPAINHEALQAKLRKAITQEKKLCAARTRST